MPYRHATVESCPDESIEMGDISNMTSAMLYCHATVESDLEEGLKMGNMSNTRPATPYRPAIVESEPELEPESIEMGDKSNIIPTPPSSESERSSTSTSSTESSSNFGRTPFSQIPANNRPRLWNMNNCLPQNLLPRPPKPTYGNANVRQQTLPIARRWSERHPECRVRRSKRRICSRVIHDYCHTAIEDLGVVIGVLTVAFTCIALAVFVGFVLGAVGYCIWAEIHIRRG